MWRRVASLAPVTSCAGSTLLSERGASRLKIPKAFLADDPSEDEILTSVKDKSPFLAFVIGGPSSGKTTQCSKIARSFGFTHLCALELLRRQIMANNEYLNVILDTLKGGKTIPSELMVKLIQKGMESSGSSRFLIEGFPRSEHNRKTFEQIVKKEVDMVLLFDCPEEEMIRRVQFSDEGGISEHTDSIKKRINVFKIASAPIIDYYTKKRILHKEIFTMLHNHRTQCMQINVRINEDEDEVFEQVRPLFTSCN